MRVALAVVFIVVAFAAAIVVSVALSLHAVDRSEHQWCETLTLLTEKPIPRPADPKANPSRENTYLFYAHLKALESKFGC